MPGSKSSQNGSSFQLGNMVKVLVLVCVIGLVAANYPHLEGQEEQDVQKKGDDESLDLGPDTTLLIRDEAPLGLVRRSAEPEPQLRRILRRLLGRRRRRRNRRRNRNRTSNDDSDGTRTKRRRRRRRFRWG